MRHYTVSYSLGIVLGSSFYRTRVVKASPNMHENGIRPPILIFLFQKYVMPYSNQDN